MLHNIRYCDFKETPTCTEKTFAHSKGLDMQVEGEEGESAADAEVLLFVAHVGVAERRLPETQAVVALSK